MKRKSILLTLICLLLVSVVGFFGCKDADIFDGDGPSEVTISGLTVKEEITVNAGSLVSIERPIVTDNDGNLLDVFASVVDKEGAFVEIKAGSFFVMDNGGYTLTYSVYTSDKVVHEASTRINVIGNNFISLNMEQVVFEGDTVTFDFSNRLSNPSFSYEVKFGDDDVPVVEKEFVCDNAGFYDCSIIAVDDYHPVDNPMVYTFQVYAHPESEFENFGMVEEFDENWEKIRDLSGFGRQGWALTNSAECGVKDHNGADSYFAYTNMEIGMTMNIFYLNPLHDSNYFAKLIDEGYDAVEFWVYVDGPSSYYLENYELDSTNYEYIRSFGYLNPFTWKKISIPLAGTEKTWVKSFVDSVDYYSTQIMHFLRFSNGDQKVNSKIYLDDICAVKKADPITTKAEFTAPKVGDLFDFDNLFSVPDYDIVYTVSSDHAYASVKQGEEYRFTSNGKYTITASPARCDYTTEIDPTVTFEVTDDVTMPKTYFSKERVEDSVDIYLNSIQTGPDKRTGLDVIIEHQGAELDCSPVITAPDGSVLSLDINGEFFSASRDGMYVLKYSADYELDGIDCTTYKEFTLDIWSQETKYILGLASDMAVCRIDSGTGSTTSYGDYLAGGLSGNKFRVDSNTTGNIVAIKPLFSKKYYENLKTEVPTENQGALIEVYVSGKVAALRAIQKSVDKTHSNININDCPVGSYYGSSSSPDYKRGYFYSSGSAENAWKNTETDLTTFIDVYDTLAENYKFVSARTDMNAGYPLRFNAYDFYVAFWTVTSGTQVYFTDFELSAGKTKYVSEIYKETGTNTNTYTMSTIEYVAKPGAHVSANVIDYEGYFYDPTVSGSVDEAIVNEDGTTVLKLYYRRLPQYTTYYYAQQLKIDASGYEYVLQGNYTSKTFARAGMTANADTSVSFPYCRLNTQLSTTSAIVPNSDELVFNLYYDTYANDLGLLDSATTDGLLDLSTILTNPVSAYSLQLRQVYIDGSEIVLDPTGIISAEGIVDYNLLDGIYVVKATPIAGGNEEVVKFEAYNSNEYTWNSVSKANVDAVIMTQIPNRLQSSTELSVKKIGLKDYYQFTVNQNVYRTFTFLPVHSYAYYNRLRGQGIELSFKFKREGAQNGWAQLYNFSTTNVCASLGATLNEWYTIKFSVEDLLDKYWSTILNPTANYKSWDDRGNIAMMVIISSALHTITVGDFTMKKVSSFDTSKVQTETLQSFDLTSFMSNKVKSQIASLEDSYDIIMELVASNGVVIDVVDRESFDLTTLPKAYFDVICYADNGTVKEEIWSCGIDIFDSNDGVVFNSVSEENLGYVNANYWVYNTTDKGEVDSTSITVEDGAYKVAFPDAPTSNTYRTINILPLHSKLYYQQYYGTGLYLTFDIVYTCEDGIYNDQPVTAGTDVTTKQFHDLNYHRAMHCGFTYNVIISLDTIIDYWSGYTNFVYTDANTSGTIKTIGLGAGKLTAKISNLKLSQPNESAETSKDYLKGKTVAVLGDSISTWVDGYFATSYYPLESDKRGEFFVQDDMWWKQVADEFGMIVSRNNSISGRTAAKAGTRSYGGNEGINLANERASDVTPDYLFIFLGTNDRTDSTIGTLTESTYSQVESYVPTYTVDTNGKLTTTVDPDSRLDTFVKAYARIVYDALRTYPGIKIYCLNLPKHGSLENTNKINGIINDIASHYGVGVVDLFTAFGDNYDTQTLDGLHPNKAGQTVMANAVIAKLNSDYSAE